MQRIFIGLMAAAFVVALGASVSAETIKGKLIDQSCYAKDKTNTGVDHKMPQDTKDCAVACAKKGAPLAILTADDKLYTVTGDLAAEKNAKLVAHLSHTVEVTGDVTMKDGKMSIAGSSLKMAK